MHRTPRFGRRRALGALAAVLYVAAGKASADPLKPNERAPELDITLLDGRVLGARELIGKVVVNVVWATWSPAARTELRELARVYERHRRAGLEVVALSIDEDPSKAREFWTRHAYPFPAAMRSDAFFDHYGRASTTPMLFIVDRDGVLRHRIAGHAGEKRLETLLGPLLAAPARSEATRR